MRAEKILGLVLVLPVALAAVALTLPQLGWCWSQHRFLSRREIVDVAIRKVISQERVGVRTSTPGATGVAFHDVIPYADPAAFRGANPGCCRVAPAVGDQGTFVPWWGRWLCGVPHNVRMAYVVKYRDDAGTARAVAVEDNVAVTACGRAARW
jgi:hypothetical protein